MNGEKLKEYVALFGGLLSAVLLFLGTLGINFQWFNMESINAFTMVLMTSIPFVIAIYGIYKNSYILTQKAKEQEILLKKKGMK